MIIVAVDVLYGTALYYTYVCLLCCHGFSDSHLLSFSMSDFLIEENKTESVTSTGPSSSQALWFPEVSRQLHTVHLIAVPRHFLAVHTLKLG